MGVVLEGTPFWVGLKGNQKEQHHFRGSPYSDMYPNKFVNGHSLPKVLGDRKQDILEADAQIQGVRESIKEIQEDSACHRCPF